MPVGTRTSPGVGRGAQGGERVSSSSASQDRRAAANGARPLDVAGASCANGRQTGTLAPAPNGNVSPSARRSGNSSSALSARTPSHHSRTRRVEKVALSEEAIRMMKRMRPAELHELSKKASEMERSKLEDQKKVATFIAATEDFVELVGNCYICLEPLLNNIGTDRFGVISWKCRCTVAQKAHSACIFSKICRKRSLCDMCTSPMLFVKSRRKGSSATIDFSKSEPSIERDEPADNSSSSSSSSSSEEESSSNDEEGGADEEDEEGEDIEVDESGGEGYV